MAKHRVRSFSSSSAAHAALRVAQRFVPLVAVCALYCACPVPQGEPLPGESEPCATGGFCAEGLECCLGTCTSTECGVALEACAEPTLLMAAPDGFYTITPDSAIAGSMTVNGAAASSGNARGLSSAVVLESASGARELAIGFGGGQLGFTRLTAGGGFASDYLVPVPSTVTDGGVVHVGQFDADGDDEVLLTPVGAARMVVVADADGTVIRSFTAPESLGSLGINAAAGDVDGDGIDEIVLAGRQASTATVVVVRIDGTLVVELTPRNVLNTLVGALDVDGDGTDEILSLASLPDASIEVFRADGSRVESGLSSAVFSTQPLLMATRAASSTSPALVVVKPYAPDAILVSAADGSVVATLGLPENPLGISMLPPCDAPNPNPVETGALCSNGRDDDGDALADCADPGCATEPACVVEPGVENCSNGVDDDGDTFADCADDDCASDPGCAAGSTEDCDNAVDDDGDTFADCADDDCASDPGCAAGSTEDCDNAVDDDGDTFADCADADCAADPACAVTPAEDCDNAVDDDGDTFADCADDDCASDPSCVDPGAEQCNNGLDEDSDGWIDCADPDCDGRVPCIDANIGFPCGGVQGASSAGGGFALGDTSLWYTSPGLGLQEVPLATFTTPSSFVTLSAGTYADVVNAGATRVVLSADRSGVAVLTGAVLGETRALAAQAPWAAVAAAAQVNGMLGSGELVWVADHTNNVIASIDAATGDVLGAVAVDLSDVATRGLTRVGDTLWVGDSNTLLELDIADPAAPTVVGRTSLTAADGRVVGIVALASGALSVAFDPSLASSVASVLLVDVSAAPRVVSTRELSTRGFGNSLSDLGVAVAGPSDTTIVLGLASFGAGVDLWYLRPQDGTLRLVGRVLSDNPILPDIAAADASWVYFSTRGGGSPLRRASFCTN